ncbi:Atxe2 family lasso peptide isopeptidase [Sphingomonas cannabina]|uniref:Atxe2 family lasso peptide isopeptidase n=1 Tax=Sphingomonas cannabina TaxID=2899123 RepID=UPI001F363180|nr:Atxe2 family lasso peptide isopeptidase [Sphingomonas cannabina]UIJ44796.1 Atxe2 family lasso peptide isopeptidase [Sphingomonas cannabina]
MVRRRPVHWSWQLLRLGVLFGCLAGAEPAWSRCADWAPLGPPATGGRTVTVKDLVELAGIGRADAEPVGGASPLAISPDRRQAAFVLQRADIDENRYCQALVVIRLDGRAPPRVLDRGGDVITTTVAMRGLEIANGFPEQIAPAWSPDGGAIAYLRHDQDSTRVWSVSLDGGSARPVTPTDLDVVSWAWMPDGRIGFAFEPDRPALDRAIDAEGQAGWIYDERVMPGIGWRPQLGAPLALAYRIADVRSGRSTPATAAQAEALRVAVTAREGQGASAGAARASAEPTASSPLSPRRLRVTDATGTPRACVWSACTGRFDGLWWDEAGGTLWFLKREGWNDRYTALYRWSPGPLPPERLLLTDDVLERCRRADARLLCIRETATRPSHIVAVDLGSGAVDTLFDPNPSFAHRAGATVERITWRNALGLEAYGDLVLPAGYRAGTRLPTIVTLYRSRGFLRGGTGNEYPIFLFAQHGYAVLSIEGPPMAASRVPGLETYDAIYAANVRDWAERRNVQSAIAAGVELLVARGIADPARLGITGLSDGASAVRFALINSELFAAASLSSCCVDESSAVLVGPAWGRYSRSVGYPLAFPVDRAFWRPGSLVLNADRIRTPLLMQLADSEALYALPSITALRQHRRPAELRIFPGEFHIKWQPRHRAAIFGTNLDWFDFWLTGRVDPAPAKAGQYRRWEQLRREHAPGEERPSARP